MKIYKKHIFLTLYLIFSLLIYIFGINFMSLNFPPEIIKTLVFITNLLIIYCLLNSLNRLSIYLFNLILSIISWIFLFLLFENTTFLTISRVLMFIFPVALLTFFLSTIEQHFWKKYKKFILAQVIFSTFFFIFLSFIVDTPILEANFFFTLMLFSLIFCFYIYQKNFHNYHSVKIVRSFIWCIVLSFSPYLLLTFLPSFCFPLLGLPVAGDWTLYFLLILPFTFTRILTKHNLHPREQWLINPLTNIWILLIFFMTIDLPLFYLLNASLDNIYLINNILMIFIVFYDLFFTVYIVQRQKKLKLAIEKFNFSKLNISKQLFSSNQTEKISLIIHDFSKNRISHNGFALVWCDKKTKPFFSIKNGVLDSLSLTWLIEETVLNKTLTRFKYKNYNCISFSVPYSLEKNGFVIFSRLATDSFSVDEISLLQDYIATLCEILFASFTFDGQESDMLISNYSPLERLTYLKAVDLALRDKQKLSEYLHDEILQKILSVKNITTTLEGSESTLKLINTTLEDLSSSLRNQTFELYPSFLITTPLKISFHYLISKLNKFYCQDITTTLFIPNDSEILTEEKFLIYRLLKELISNIFKHAKATQILLKITISNHSFNIILQDDGIGMVDDHFSVSKDIKEHYGLVSIYQEIFFLGGNFDIKSTPGKGVKLEINLPKKDRSSNETIIN